MKPLVSVIIPTKDSSEKLAQTLSTVKSQTYPKIEILVVDNFSNDSTLKIAKKFGCRTFSKGNERSSQLNYGFSRSKGEFIYRIDDDFLLDKELIEKAVELCMKKKFDALAVPNISVGEAFWQKVRVLERDCYYNDEYIVGARFFRRSAFKKVGGFDESLIACEDYDIHNRLLQEGLKIGFLDGCFERHTGEAKCLSEAFKKNYYYGKSLYRYISRHKRRAVRQFIPVRGAYIRNIFKMIKRPHLLCGLVVLKSVQYSAAFMGIISYLLTKKIKNETSKF